MLGPANLSQPATCPARRRRESGAVSKHAPQAAVAKEESTGRPPAHKEFPFFCPRRRGAAAPSRRRRRRRALSEQRCAQLNQDAPLSAASVGGQR
jgi:hypothetical protein